LPTATETILNDAAALHLDTLRRSAATIDEAGAAMRRALAGGGKILVFGNGGSASDAQHFASELVNRFQTARAALAGLALTTDTSVLTSIANDDAFANVFARQIEALGRPADVAVGISTSGSSANVRAGLDRARRLGLTTVALAGATPVDGVDVCVTVPSAVTARVQEVHRTIIHAWCAAIEAP
jgi:D-sedoheptulose 7-phosphate isomerase